MKYGYVEDVIGKEDYTLGALPSKVLQPAGQWFYVLPEKEVQIRKIETMNCTNYGTLNALETLIKMQYGEKQDFSERYTGVLTGTNKEGNSPHKVIEVIRKYTGLIHESELPFDDTIETWEQYYSGVTFAHKLKGVRWLAKWNVQHEWVLYGEHNDWQVRLKDALQYSPIGIAVNAWNKEGDRYIRRGMDNHWCVLVGYLEGKHWVIFDSYDKHFKHLVWNYNFYRAKRYSITPRLGYDPKFVVRVIQGLMGAYI